MNRAVPVLIVIFLATSVAATGYALSTSSQLGLRLPWTNPAFGFTDTFAPHQGISGQATIGNVAPLCTATGSQPATGPNLVIASTSGKTVVVQLNWSLVNRCSLVAQFHVPLQPGTFSITLSPCNYLGCNRLPITVAVHPGAFTPVTIDIVTGIY